MSAHPEVDGPVLLYDGVCRFCDAGVQWVLARDRHAVFRFAPSQSAGGRALLARAGVPLVGETPGTVVLVHGTRVWTRSDAVLAVFARLGAPWSWFSALRVVPRPVRDSVYGAVAAIRRRVFGTLTACRVPTPEQRARFLD